MAEGNPAAPRLGLSRRRLVVGGIFVLLTLAALYFLLPKIAGFGQTWGRLRRGNTLWLLVAAVVECVSIAGYIVLFRTVFGRGMERLTWKVSVEIPLAGIAAVRLFAAAGAGGVAVTAWALDRAGMEASVIACRIVAALIIEYVVYLGAVVLFGILLGSGVLAGRAPFELTWLPAALSLALGLAALSAILLPSDLERRLHNMKSGPRLWQKLVDRLATVPAALGTGARTAVVLIREGHPGLLGAVVYWGFDIAALDCSFHAFGASPPLAILVLGYFLGTLGSLLPVPGGIGGVEGAMIGVFAAFGVPAGQAVIAVLAYRAISFWLPTLPGVAGYFALRRSVNHWGRSPRSRSAEV